MLKSLPKTSHQLAVCEANFLRLKKILQGFSKNKYSFETINPDSIQLEKSNGSPILLNGNIDPNEAAIMTLTGQLYESL